MAIIIPERYHIEKQLQKHRVHCITPQQANHQDIRPLRIGILNIMPMAETYEFNLLYLLGRSVLQIEPVFLRLKTHSYSSSKLSHIDEHYITFEDAIKDKGLDGLVITGAPVEAIPFEKVTYWDEFIEILDYAHEHIAATLGICWGGLALAKYLGIDKENYEEKLFGLYPTKNIDRTHRVTGDLDDVFWCPQSRHSGISDAVLEQEAEKGNIRLLAHNDTAGYVIFESSDERMLMHLGHAEYQTERLLQEYRRDVSRGKEKVVPPINLDLENPVNNWRSHGQEFFLQWIKKCYLDTPYVI